MTKVNRGRKGCVISRVVRLAVCLLPAVLIACSGHKPVPLGTIPPVQEPSAQVVEQTKFAVVNHEAKFGRTPHINCEPYKRTKIVLDRLSTAIGAKPGTWPLYMVNAGPEVNAAAVNQNSIIVYENLLNKVNNEAELATVLAHELGHILAKHGHDKDKDKKVTAAKIGSQLLGAAAVVGAAVGGMSPDAAQSLGNLTVQGTSVVSAGFILQYDRDQEYEADQIGLMIMGKAGYDPRAAVTFWERANEVFGGGGSGGPSFLSTHPSDSGRARELKRALPVAIQYYEESKAGIQAKNP